MHSRRTDRNRPKGRQWLSPSMKILEQMGRLCEDPRWPCGCSDPQAKMRTGPPRGPGTPRRIATPGFAGASWAWSSWSSQSRWATRYLDPLGRARLSPSPSPGSLYAVSPGGCVLDRSRAPSREGQRAVAGIRSSGSGRRWDDRRAESIAAEKSGERGAHLRCVGWSPPPFPCALGQRHLTPHAVSLRGLPIPAPHCGSAPSQFPLCSQSSAPAPLPTVLPQVLTPTHVSGPLPLSTRMAQFPVVKPRSSSPRLNNPKDWFYRGLCTVSSSHAR